MDNHDTFNAGAAYQGCTLAQLRQFEWEGKATPRMLAEIERRLAVQAGDLNAMTAGERLTRATFCRDAFRR